MSGCVNPAPSREGRQSSVRRQFAYITADVDRVTRVQARHPRHHAATDRRIRRWIRAFAGRVWKFLAMSVNRYVPVAQQGIQRSDVIEVSVRQNDRVGWRVAEMTARPALDPSG